MTAARAGAAEAPLASLRDMLRVRRLEEKTAELYEAGKIRGFLHLYIGEEAVAAGVLPELTNEDAVFATYREHGHALLRGVPARAIMAEMFGKAEGCSRGRGGSMHLFDAARRFYGGSAIVGGALPMAAGLALADKLQRRAAVTACFFGEGAMAEGTFHESLNLAALWRLPLLLVCENNLYAMGTALAISQSQTDLAAKAACYRIPAEAVDGMDVVAVSAAARKALAIVRAGEGPCFLECRTYRFRAHSMFDPELYRPRQEVEAWKGRCPIATLAARLRAEGLLDDSALAALESDVEREVADAVAFAEAGTREPPSTLLADVYATGATAGPGSDGRTRERRQDPGATACTGSDGRTRERRQDPGATAGPGSDGMTRERRHDPGDHGAMTDATTQEAMGTGQVRTTYREAVRQALCEALRRDERVFLLGEDVGRYGGCFAVSRGMLAEFGPERIRDTPLSESAFVGAGIGAAIGGMRPIVEIMTVNFSLLALDQIVNNAALLRHMSGGQIGVPLVIRMATGAGRQLAAQHSHSLEVWYAHVPGIKVAAPATLEDARGMLWTALEDPDPVILFEHMLLYGMEGDLAADAGPVDLQRAAIRRPGRDVSLITYGGSLPKALEAAALLAAEGIDAEVVDLRVLRPLDTATLLASVARTRRAVVVDEGWKTCGLAAEICACIAEGAFYDLDAPPTRVCAAETPIPYAAQLEQAALPQVPAIVQAARDAVGARG